MFAIDFEYAGEKLSDYGFIICNFNGSGLETVSSGSDIKFNQAKASQSDYFFSELSNEYEQSYIPEPFQICKNPCLIDDGDITLKPLEISALQKWLCRKNRYYKFKIIQDGYEHVFWNAKFSAKQIEIGGKVIGLELNMITDAPFAYMDLIDVNETLSANDSFDIYDISDEEGYIYPDIEITLLDSGRFILYNTFDNNVIFKMSIYGCNQNETIYISGKNKIIITSDNFHDTFSKDFNYDFPRIANTYECNKNTFTCNMACNISLSYNPIVKVGL